jgi:hypothetical protein
VAPRRDEKPPAGGLQLSPRSSSPAVLEQTPLGIDNSADPRKATGRNQPSYVFRHSKNFELEYRKSLRSFVPAIPMVKTAESRIRSHGCRRRRPALHRPSLRRVFIEGIVNPIVVVTVDIVAHQPAQMSFVQRDHVVQDLPATTSDPSLRDPVLPRRLNTSEVFDLKPTSD